MKEASPKIQSAPHNKLIDTLFFICIISIIPSFIGSALKSDYNNSFWIFGAYTFLIFTIISFTILRSKIPTHIKTHAFTIILISISVVSIIEYRTVSTGFFGIVGITIGTLVYGKKYGYLYLILYTLSIILLAFLHTSNKIHTNIKFEEHVNNIGTWLDYSASIVLSIITLLYSSNFIYRYLLNSNSTLRNKTKSLEKALKIIKTQEEHFRLITEYSSDMISTHDAAGTYVYVSPMLEATLGYTKEEIIGTNIYAYLHPNDEEMIQAFHSQLLSKENPIITCEYQYKTKHKGYIWVESKCNVLEQKENKREIVVITRDITERKLFEKKFIEKELRYRTLIETSPESVFIASAKTYKIVDMNENTCRLFKLSREELLEKTVFELSTEYQENGKRSFDYAMELLATLNSLNPRSFEWIHINANGEKIPCEILISEYPSSNDERFVRCIIRDITEKRKTEHIIRENEIRFQTFMENTPAFAYIKNAENIYLYKNTPSYQTEKNSYKTLLADITNCDIETRKMIVQADKLISTGQSNIQELEYTITSQNIHYWIQEIKFRLMLPDGTIGIGGLAFDITAIKEVQIELEIHKNKLESLIQERTQDLQTANKELLESNTKLAQQKQEMIQLVDKLTSIQNSFIESEKMSSLGILTAGVAHEINNPLTFIQSGLDALDSLSINSTNIEEFISAERAILSKMKIGVDRVTNIVRSLNHFSRKGTDLNQTCDLHIIIENCLLILNHQLKNKCTLIRNYAKSTITLYANESNLHQVFLNVLSNAIHAIENQGTITINTAIESNTCKITIQDTGIGMNKTVMSHMFDPFFTTKTTEKGTGLGLSIVYGIIQECKGEIFVDSKQEIGTTITIILPIDA